MRINIFKFSLFSLFFSFGNISFSNSNSHNIKSNPMLDLGEKLYKQYQCSICHGDTGQKTLAPNYPKLAGQNQEYVYNQMLDIKDGKRNNGLSTAMQAMISNIKNDELKAISYYVESIK